jgi:RHS repeat-associated protein
VTATAADERSPLPGPTWPPSAPPTSFPLADRRPVVLADDPCEAGFSGADPEYAGIYLHARYFDPKLGTFLSPDPIGVRGGLNLYGYGFGNPISGSDRSGLDWVPCQQGSCWDGGWGATVDVPGPSTPATPSNPLPGGVFPGGDIGNVFMEDAGNGTTGNTDDPKNPKVPTQPKEPAKPESVVVQIARKVNITIAFSAFDGFGGEVLLTFGGQGFGGCAGAGGGVGGSFEAGAQTGLPDSGLYASGKLEVGVSPIADVAITPSYNISTDHGTFPVQGEIGPLQAQMDLASGEGFAGYRRKGGGPDGGKGVRVAGDAHVAGGVCIAYEW